MSSGTHICYATIIILHLSVTSLSNQYSTRKTPDELISVAFNVRNQLNRRHAGVINRCINYFPAQLGGILNYLSDRRNWPIRQKSTNSRSQQSTMKSFISYSSICDFPIENLPYGIFSTKDEVSRIKLHHRSYTNYAKSCDFKAIKYKYISTHFQLH